VLTNVIGCLDSWI